MLLQVRFFDAVAAVVACLTSLLKLSNEPGGKSVFCIVSANQNLVAGLSQSVERSPAEREVAGSIPGARPILRVLK